MNIMISTALCRDNGLPFHHYQLWLALEGAAAVMTQWAHGLTEGIDAAVAGGKSLLFFLTNDVVCNIKSS